MYYIVATLPTRKILFVTYSLTIANKKIDIYSKMGFECSIERK